MGESFQKLNLTNAYLFAAALQDEEICRNLLEIVLNKEIPRVKAHAEPMAESMAETLAKPMAESMAESLAASKVAQSILSLAAELGTIPAEEQQRIAGEQDDETLEKWLKLAARSTTVEEFLSGM